ncbi:hypothetical protein QBC44DRAFT_292058 [Cladorrhinum sp. PSN332]|nr:hypothetical protein QBC44DRAFT_292058 [Cladorrhinum sp. PSN332]
MSPSLTLPILPSSPITPKLPTPSPQPYPWSWRCHKCRSTYRLSATRRCLECGHIFCIKILDSSSSSSSCSSSPSHKVAKSRRSKRDNRTCSAEFDYLTWQVWGSYRRLQSSSSSSSSQTYATFTPTPSTKTWEPISRREAKRVALAKERTFVECRYDCSVHCDYPSECRHSVYKAWSEGRARRNDKGKLEMVDNDDDNDDDNNNNKMEVIREEPAAEVSPVTPTEEDIKTKQEWPALDAVTETTKKMLEIMTGILLDDWKGVKSLEVIVE